MAEDISASGQVHPDEGSAVEFTSVNEVDEVTTTYFTSPVPQGPAVVEIAHLWADRIISTHTLVDGETASVGTKVGNTFEIEDVTLAPASFPLVTDSAGRRTLHFDRSMTGWVTIDDVVYSLSEAIDEGLVQGRGGSDMLALGLTPATRARIDVGLHTFVLRTTERVAMPPRRLRFDGGLLAFGGVSASVHVMIVLLAFFVPPQSKTFALGEVTVEDRFISTLIEPNDPITEPDEGHEEADEGGEVAAGDAVKAGDEEAETTGRRMAIVGNAHRITLKKDSREVARTTGALAILNNSTISADWGTGVATEGFDAVSAMGGVTGDRTGQDYGHGGFALFGVGEKRGGGGVRTSFQAAFSTVSRRSGPGSRPYGDKVGKLAPKKEHKPTLYLRPPIVSDGLDREFIQRTVRKHRKEVKYCYEQELIKNHKLAGKLTVSFTIAANGNVAAAVPTGSTLGNAAIGRCVAGKVRHWSFPSIKGGGIVVVKYPFVFAPQ